MQNLEPFSPLLSPDFNSRVRGWEELRGELNPLEGERKGEKQNADFLCRNCPFKLRKYPKVRNQVSLHCKGLYIYIYIYRFIGVSF